MFIRATPVDSDVATASRLTQCAGRLGSAKLNSAKSARRRWLAGWIAAGLGVGTFSFAAFSAPSAIQAQDSFGPTRVTDQVHPLAHPTSPAAQPANSSSASLGQPIPRMRTSDLLRTTPTTPASYQASRQHVAANAGVTSTTDAARRPGWDLQWRKSPQVASQEAARISDQAFQQPAMQPAAEGNAFQQSVAHAQPMSQAGSVRENTPQPQPIQRAAFMQQAGGGFELPDFDPAPADAQPIAPPTTGNGAGSQPNWNANPFRDEAGGLPNTTPNNPAGSPIEMVPPGLEELPSPETLPTQPSDSFGQPDSSIRDMLEDESNLPTQPQPLELAPETETSPSDRFNSNPFERRSEDERTRDELDRMELEDPAEDRLRPQADRDDAAIMGDDGPNRRLSGLSCDDFRERIASQTIDLVSLDISPPYRPDIIDEAEYQKVKERFDERQESRTWRSIDGRTMGTGRLVDLAYEKAVIVTEFGTREELPINRLSESDLGFISENWGLPTECLLEQVDFQPRRWKPTTVVWAASNLCHKPLYFEEVNLERYGHTAGPVLQPVLSSAHFFANIAVLPYKMGVHSPHECQYALGYYRPGNCAPWIIPPVPLSLKGAWYQAAAVSGTALLVP